MRNTLLRHAIVACFATLLSASVLAQSSTSGVKKPGGADSNVKTDVLSNVPGTKLAPPARKGGPASKGAYGTCDIHVNNETNLNIQYFFNGNLAGIVGAYGDLYEDITPGTSSLYARAVFTDGSVLTFGPVAYQCAGGDYTWNLVN